MIESKQHLRFSSDINNVHLVEDFVEKICDEFKINTTYFGNILIAITEAVENAIIHGNRGIVEKTVDLYFEYDNNGFQFTIQDEGNGFDFDNIPDPTEAQNANVGRGIYLIKALSDEVNFCDGGSTLEMGFQIENMNQQTAINRINELQNFSQKKEDSLSKKEKEENQNKLRNN